MAWGGQSDCPSRSHKSGLWESLQTAVDMAPAHRGQGGGRRVPGGTLGASTLGDSGVKVCTLSVTPDSVRHYGL